MKTNYLGHLKAWPTYPTLQLWEMWQTQYPDKVSAIAHAIWFVSIDNRYRGIWNPLKFYSIKREFCRRYSVRGVAVKQQDLPCLSCKGSGIEPGRKFKKCIACKGVGIRRSFWIYAHQIPVGDQTLILHAEALPPLIVEGQPLSEWFDPIQPSFLPYTGLIRLLSVVAAVEFEMKFFNGCYHRV